MKRRHWQLVAAAVMALAITLACGDEDGPTAAVPGTLVLTLTTPNADDGAILFSISGGGIDIPTSVVASNLLFHRLTGTASMNAVVVGDIAAGALVSFEVPDVGAAPSYSATITEVADRNNALRTSLAGYSLSVSRE
ncbi:MAG: hypothetical protein JSU87_14035 [Gemmatimonadota bacterium]|nr:MAG: hypothetical protein JSU87_14035 [Gemmatimonadota bacterium]